ncbi:MAG: hypothetical protein ACI4MQ_03490 [Candidatus Coproplasma sp.]
MLFDLTHILYIIISIVLTVGLLVLFTRFKSFKAKEIILLIIGIVTMVLHVCSIWVEFLMNGKAEISDYFLFPIYFCNLLMLFLFICGIIRNKDSVAFRWFATFTAYGSVIGGLISLFYPSYYLYNPTLLDCVVIKSLLSHSTMLLGGLYLFTGGFVKIRVNNMLPLVAGLLLCGAIGFLTNLLFSVCGLEAPNAMYLQASALDGVPFFNAYGIALLMVILVFLFTVVWEFFACKKGERWYNLLAKKEFKSFIKQQ